MEQRGSYSGAFIGEGTLLVRCAEVFARAGHQVAVVITANPVIQAWAAEQNVPHVASETDLEDVLSARPVDYLFSVTNLNVIGDNVLRLPRKMAINFHDALLPRYAGVHATSWALMNREREHGVTWHEMLGRLDAGRVLKQQSVEISDGETAFTLNAKCYEAGAASFAELVDELSAGTATGSPQDFSSRSYYGLQQRPEAACTLSWNDAAEDSAALVASLAFGPTDNPLGLAKFELHDGTVVLAREAAVLATRSEAPPGTVTDMRDGAIRVTTGSADLSLRALQMIDGAPIDGAHLERSGLRVGTRLPDLSPERAARLSKLHRAQSRHETYWRGQLAKADSIELPYASRNASA